MNITFPHEHDTEYGIRDFTSFVCGRHHNTAVLYLGGNMYGLLRRSATGPVNYTDPWDTREHRKRPQRVGKST